MGGSTHRPILLVGLVAALAAAWIATPAQGATRRPLAVISVSTSTRQLGPNGGKLVISARVSGASACAFLGPTTPLGSQIPLNKVGCASGRATTTVHVAGNVRSTPATLTYYVRAYNASGHNILRGITVTELGSAQTIPTQVASVFAVATTSLPTATVGSLYSATLSASGGTLPFTWSVDGTSTLPTGLSLSSAGVFSGVPTSAGSWSITVQVQDGSMNTQTTQATLNLTVTNAPSLAVATTTLPGGTAGSSYLAALGATGGMQAYAWSVVSGTLPAGLALSSTGVLSGTPTTAGTSRFTVQVRDSSPSPQTAQASVSVTVASSSTLSVMTTALPAGVAGTAYSATLGAEGGKAPYTWSMTSGSLPTGLTLSSGGIVSGTPTTAGSTSATFQVQDSSSTPLSVQATITLTVTSAVSGLTAVDSTSSNWSGYAETGTSFTHATGTFTIPSIVANGAVGDTSEWVGIDGTGNSDLIQAGVDEEVDAGSSTASIWAWWEILPAYATPVTLPVSAGDTVTVSIDELSAGEWKISIFDVTSGDDFTIEQAYSGPGTSAEWIVEAPTSGSTSSVVTLLDYTPAVTFTELGVTGSASGLYRIVLDQNSQAVSTPSALDATGFVVQYGSTTPSPP